MAFLLVVVRPCMGSGEARAGAATSCDQGTLEIWTCRGRYYHGSNSLQSTLQVVRVAGGDRGNLSLGACTMFANCSTHKSPMDLQAQCGAESLPLCEANLLHFLGGRLHWVIGAERN